MSGPANTRRNLLLAALFLAVLAAPLVSLPLVSPQDISEVEQVEKRRMAAFPAPPGDTAALRAWPGRFQAWFGDHMGLRRPLVRLHNRVRLTLLGTSPHTGVAVGRDGWLFAADEASLRSYRHQFPFTPEQLVLWQHALEARRDWLAERGIRYLFVVVPDKATIYGEFMPPRLRPLADPARLDQFIGHMARHSDVEILDLRPALTAARSTAWPPLYHRTDSHWNGYGAFLGYREIMRRVARDFPVSAPRPLSDFEVQTRLQPGGDLAGLFDLNAALSESAPVLEPRFSPCTTLRPATFEGHFTWFTSRGPLRSRCDRAGLPMAVVFRDSFTDAMLPLLGEHFADAVYIVNPFMPEIMEQVLAGREMSGKPDVVIEQIVQRKFYMLEPEVTQPVRQAMLRGRFVRDGAPLVSLSRPGGWPMVADREGQVFMLPPVRVGAGNWPVVRLVLESPAPATLQVAFRNGAATKPWATDPVPLVAGRNEVYSTLPLVGFDGALAMLPPVVPGGLRILELEVRAVPLHTRPADARPETR